MTPLKNFGQTREIEEYFWNEILWANVQLDLIVDKVLQQKLLKNFAFRVFFVFAKVDEEFHSF